MKDLNDKNGNLNLFKKFIRDIHGGIVEYLILIAVAGVIASFLFPTLHNNTDSWFEDMKCNVNTGISDSNQPCEKKPIKVLSNKSNGTSGGGAPTASHDVVVLTVYNSCKEILQNQPDAQTGTYAIKAPDGNLKSVTCDMVTNGGGWMMVSNYDFSKDRTPPAGSGLVTKDPFTSTSYPGTAPAGWYPQFNFSAGVPQNKTLYFNNDRFTFTDIRMEVKLTMLWSTDSFGNTHAGIPNRMSIEDQYVDGYSFTYGEPGSRKHLWTATVSGSAPSDQRATFLKTDIIGGTNIDKTVSKTVPSTNERIETRIMLDQSWNDENIGMHKLNIWIR
jgi:hypothetical protein